MLKEEVRFDRKGVFRFTDFARWRLKVLREKKRSVTKREQYGYLVGFSGRGE